MTRLLRWVTTATAFLVPVATLLVLSLTFFVGMTYLSSPTLSRLSIAVAGPAVAGQTVPVRVDYCKERNIIPIRGRWSLQNEVAIILPEVIFALPSGCHVKVIGVDLSPHVIPGRYKLQVEAVYKPWPWVEETIVRQSQPFTILKGEQ